MGEKKKNGAGFGHTCGNGEEGQQNWETHAPQISYADWL